MTVAELGERMSSAEFGEWMAYYQIEPFGEERADIRQALTTSAVHNSIQAQTKHPKWTKPEDFLMFRDRTPQPKIEVEPDASDLLAKFKAFTGKGAI